MYVFTREKYDNSKKGAVLMYCTPNLFSGWARHSLYLNKKYTEKNGYDFILKSEPYDSSVTHAWQKIPGILELFDKGYDFVMYIDTDAIFYKQDITIESIIKKYSGDMLFCSDEKNSNGLYKINGGTVIANNTKKSRYLLEKWWNTRHKYKVFPYEQLAISDIYEKKIPDIESNMITVAPENEFNSSYGDLLKYTNNSDEIPPDNFVLHFMAMDDNTREKALSKIVNMNK
jgi:hypothetical protein